MKRTGSIGSRGAAGRHDDVPAGEVGSRAAATTGGRPRGVGLADRAAATAATTASTIRGRSASRPTPRWPRGQRTRLRLDDPVAEASRSRAHVGPVSRGVSTCRRPWPERRRPGRSVARHVAVIGVAGKARRPSRRANGRWPGRRRSRRPCRATTMCPIRRRAGGPRTSVSTGWREAPRTSAGRRTAPPRRQHAPRRRRPRRGGAAAARRPCTRRSSRSRRGRSAAGKPARGSAPDAVPVPRRPPSQRRASSCSPPATSAWRIARPLSVRSGSTTSIALEGGRPRRGATARR